MDIVTLYDWLTLGGMIIAAVIFSKMIVAMWRWPGTAMRALDEEDQIDTDEIDQLRYLGDPDEET